MGVSDEQLLQQAIDVMKNAYCPYSKFPVGAALLTDDDTIVLGVNCENASYGATICAERSAMTAALTRGYRKFKAIAISTEMEEPASPCGMCRQFLIEFGDFKVILGSSRSNSVTTSSTVSLLPLAFTPVSLDEHSKQAAKA
ncbi:Cytidine deaminase [Trichostrongylus colubriformis]|uniref:Cytidine deaminase n=1 Tax=Trichostrongylus colubriformis TaxID=6319 RepID=A0AAN8FK57_TRICO